MKKLLLIIMSLIIMLCLVACGEKEEEEGLNNGSNNDVDSSFEDNLDDDFEDNSEEDFDDNIEDFDDSDENLDEVPDEGPYTFRGKIIEMYMDNLLVEPLEDEEIRKSADQIRVWFGQNPEFHPPIFPAGTLVEIEFDGNINETYPAQINATNLRTINEQGEDIIPDVVSE